MNSVSFKEVKEKKEMENKDSEKVRIKRPPGEPIQIFSDEQIRKAELDHSKT